jgi:hypothetical protein
MLTMSKKILSIIGVTGALGIGAFALNAVGPASAGSLGVTTQAQTSSSAASPSADSGDHCGSRPKDVLDGLVQNGTITQEQEDAIVQAFQDARPDHGGRLGVRARAIGGAVKVAADTIGVSVEDLKTALQSGKSIADVANEHSVDPATVVQAIIDAGNARIDAAVTSGKLPQDRADALKARLAKGADQIVNHTKPDC